MTENDCNLIQPTHGLPHLTNVNRVQNKDAEDKKRDKKKQASKEEESLDDPFDETTIDELNHHLPKNDTDEHQIDYCA